MADAGTGWTDWARTLTAQLLALPDGGTVTVRADTAQVAPLVVRPPRVFGLVPAKRVRTAPEVVLTRQEDHLRAECTGDASFGGRIPLPAEQREQMVGLGWHGGGGPQGRQWTRHWPDDIATEDYLPAALAAGAGTLLSRTFAEVFGCADPAALEQVTGAPKNPR